MYSTTLLTRMRTPGALELLAAYEVMSPEARTALVTLLRAVTGASASSPVQTPAKARQLA